MESVNRLNHVYDPLERGNRALDEKTRDLVDQVGNSSRYDLVIREQEYPYTKENTEANRVPEKVELGFHEKGKIPLAAIDVEGEKIEVIYDSISGHEDDKRDKARKLGRSIENVNSQCNTDWSASLYIQPEENAYNEPSLEIDSGVAYTPETLETIRSSDSFSKLSSGMFAGWLEISPERLLDADRQ